MGVGGGDGDRLGAGLGIGAAGADRARKGPGQAGDAQQGFALLAVGMGIGGVDRARLKVQQNGADDRLEIAAHAGAVIVEFLHDAIEIIAAGMAGHEALDELAADVRAHIRIVKNRVDRLVQIRQTIGVVGGRGRDGLRPPGGRQDDIVQEQLGAELVVGGDEDHGVGEIGGGIPIGRQSAAGLVGLVIIPAREHARKSADDILAVGRHEGVLRIQHQGSVRPHPVEADGKKLVDFAGVIFVGMEAGDEAALVVALHVEIDAHDRMQRHRLEQGAEIAEDIVEKRVVVRGQGVGIGAGERPVFRGHQDFAEGEGGPLAQLVRGGDGLLPPGVKHQRAGKRLSRIGAHVRQHEGQMMGHRQPELADQPVGVSDRLNRSDVRRAGAIGRLGQKTDCGVGVRVVIRPGRRRGRRCENLRAVGQGEVAVDFTARIIDGVNVQIRLALADDFHHVRRLQRSHRLNRPDIAAIRLRRGRIHVKHDLAGILEIGIAVDMLAGLGRGQPAVARPHHRLAAVRAEL